MTNQDETRRYTYADLLSWTGEERYELLEGKLVRRTGASSVHQGVVLQLSLQIGRWLEGKSPRLFFAPLDVCLFAEETDPPDRVDTVLQPDLMVLCDPKKITAGGVRGAPDLVVEVLDPDTRKRDFGEKFRLYSEAGVREYWLVDPEAEIVLVMHAEDGAFSRTCHLYHSDDTIPVSVLPGCVVDLDRAFRYARELQEPEGST